MRKTLGKDKLLSDLILIGTDAASSAFLDIQHKDKVLVGSIIIPEVSQVSSIAIYRSNKFMN